MGGYGLSLEGERQFPGRSRQDQPDPPVKAHRPAGAEAVSPDQCQEICSAVEHIFAQQNDSIKLTTRGISIKRAEATIVMANIAYNLSRWRWWET